MLMAEVKTGSRAAFRELFDVTSDKVYGILYHMLRSRAEADDVLQEVYIQVWTKAHLFLPEISHARNWINHVARHAAIDRLRALNRQPKWSEYDPDLPTGETGPEDAAVLGSELRRLSACLDRLDPNHAQAVRRAYMEGASYAELAEAYDVPMNTLKSWLRRSLISLRDCLARKGEH